MLGPGMNLVTTIIGFGMSAAFIVFVCTRIICRRLRAESRPMFEVDTTAIDLEQQPEHRNNGLAPVLVAAIPTMKFNRDAFSSGEDVQCSICLGEYQEKEILRIMPRCSHNFHLSCIDVWLTKQSTCPVCRLPIQEYIGSKHIRQATISMVQFVDGLETSSEHSRQWLLPGPERSAENPSNQERLDSVPRNPEVSPREMQPAG